MVRGDGLGYVYLGWGFDFPWFIHTSMGQLYYLGDLDNLWVYGPDFGWAWTSRSTFPHLFVTSKANWYLYLLNSADPRWFYDYAAVEWLAFVG